MKHALLLLPEENRDSIYSPPVQEKLRQLVQLTDCCHAIGQLEELRPALADTHIIMSGWGMMKLDEDFLAAAPHLEAVFYGAGSVRPFITDAFWRRNILLTSAYAANAIPVAEYTLAAIIFGAKHALSISAAVRHARSFRVPRTGNGLYNTRIGVIGAGMVGSEVLEKLKGFKVQTFCCDPRLTPERAAALHTTPMKMEEIFRTCDIVTLHAPNIPSTEGMIRGEHFRSMKEGAVFINTARGKIICEPEMIEALREGKIFAFLDVTYPEPPAPESPFYDLPNVFLTPHLAGSCNDEIQRQGEYALEELIRYLQSEPPRYPVTQDMMEWMA